MTSQMLDKFSKILRTDFRYVAKGGFWLSVGQFVTSLISLFLSIAFANLITPETYGTYRYILSIIGIIASFAIASGPAIVQAVAAGYEGTYKKMMPQTLLWNSILFLTGFGVAGYYFIQGNTLYALLIAIASAVSPIQLSYSLFTSYLDGTKNFKTRVLLQTAQTAIPSTLLFLVMLFSDSIILLITTYFVSYAVINYTFHHLSLHLFKPNDRVNEKSFRYGIDLSIMTSLPNLMSYLDKVLVFQYFGTAQLAAYAFASIPLTQLKMPSRIAGRLALPKLSEYNLHLIQNTIHRKFLIFFLGNALIVIAYILMAPFLFGLFYPQYTNAVFYSQLLALGALAAPATFYNQALLAHVRKRELYIVKFVTPIFKLLLMLSLTPFYGILGIIIAVVSTEFLILLLQIILFLKIKTNQII